MLVDFDVRVDNREGTFPLKGAVLWIIDLYFGLKLKCLDEFVSYKLFFSRPSQDIN